MFRKSLVVVCLIALANRWVCGQGPAERISRAAQESIEQLDPTRIAAIEPSKAKFRSAVQSLRDHLARTADDRNASAWLRYLAVDEVLEGIESGASEASLAKLAFRCSNRTIGVHPGLEVDAILAVREAATELSNALRFRKGELIVRALSKRLQTLSEDWIDTGVVPSVEADENLRLVLGLLEKTGQDVALLDGARDSYCYPNLHLLVSGSAVERLIRRPVDQPSPVRDCILGTRLVGNARLCGDVTAVLLPSVGSVRLQLVMNGTIQSRNIGYNGPVRLRTSSQGQVQATRLMTISESGVSLEPVAATGTLQSQVNKIEHRLKIVRRIARRKAAEQKPLTDSIAKRKMLNRVMEGFVEQTDSAVAGPMPNLMDQARPWLLRLDLEEPARLIGSTSDSVYFTGTVRRDEQLAAPTPAPEVSSRDDVTLQIHESLINNTVGAIFAGRTMTRDEIVALAPEAGGEKNAESDEAEQDFEIDFDMTRPILFEARDGELRVGLRVTRFKQGKTERKDLFEVSATYRPVLTTDGRVLLDRVGQTKIDFPRSRSGIGKAGMRGAVKKSIAEAFPKTLLEQPLAIPADTKLPALANQTYSVRQFQAQDGWLTISLGQ